MWNAALIYSQNNWGKLMDSHCIVARSRARLRRMLLNLYAAQIAPWRARSRWLRQHRESQKSAQKAKANEWCTFELNAEWLNAHIYTYMYTIYSMGVVVVARLRLLQLIKNYCIRRKVHKNIEHKRNRHPLHFAPPLWHNALQRQQQQQQRRPRQRQADIATNQSCSERQE